MGQGAEEGDSISLSLTPLIPLSPSLTSIRQNIPNGEQ